MKESVHKQKNVPWTRVISSEEESRVGVSKAGIEHVAIERGHVVSGATCTASNLELMLYIHRRNAISIYITYMEM